jgi:hypothetical protein
MDELRRRMKSDHYIEKAVVQLLALKLRSGSDADSVKKFCMECVDEACRNTTDSIEHQGLDIHRLGSVLRAWHTETRFLTQDGLPKPLKSSGKGSLKSLIQLFYPASKFDRVFSKLRDASLIRRSGRGSWIPTERHARISRLSQETLEHLSEGVARYVETVTRNVTTTREDEVLFERSCKVTRLPKKEFAAFRSYVGQQAIAFITAMDDWLESRNSKKSKRLASVTTAGVYTFAYVDRNARTKRS